MSDVVRRRGLTRRVTNISLLLAVGVVGYVLGAWLAGRQADAATASAYRSLALNAVLVAAALAAGRLPGLFLDTSREERVAPAVLAVSYVLAGVGMWRGLAAFSDRATVLPGAGRALLMGMIALAVSHLAVYAQRRGWGGVFSGMFRWVIETRALVVIIALAAGAYAFTVRPLYMGKSAYSTLIEWTVIAVAGMVILGIAQFRVSRNLEAAPEPSAPNWRRHLQQVSPKADSDYVQLRSLERRFVEESDQTMLLHYLVTAMAGNEVSETNMTKALAPLIEYRGQPGHGREKKQQIEKERGRLLRTVVAAIQSAVQPLRYAGYGPPHSVSLPQGERAPRGGVASVLGPLSPRTSSFSRPPSGRRTEGEGEREGRGEGATATLGLPDIGEEPQTLSQLVEGFCAAGGRSRLLVRLSLMLATSGTREEDADEVLRPLVKYHRGSHNGRGERERLWQGIVTTTARYAPRVRLKG